MNSDSEEEDGSEVELGRDKVGSGDIFEVEGIGNFSKGRGREIGGYDVTENDFATDTMPATANNTLPHHLLTGIQYLFNSAVLFTREHIKAGGSVGETAAYIANSTIARILHCTPESLTTSVFPRNQFTAEELMKFASAVKSFGAAGRRTQEQTKAAAKAAEVIINNLPKNSIQIWTDGSKTGTGPSGPTGAGAYVIYTGASSPTHQLKYYLGQSTNQTAELWAIGGALTTVREESWEKGTEFHIFSDSEFSINCLKGVYPAKVHYNIVKLIKEIIDTFPKDSITFHKVAGHAGIPGNEIADELANHGAKHSEHLTVEIDLQFIAKTYGFNHLILRDELYGDIT